MVSNGHKSRGDERFGRESKKLKNMYIIMILIGDSVAEIESVIAWTPMSLLSLIQNFNNCPLFSHIWESHYIISVNFTHILYHLSTIIPHLPLFLINNCV